MSALSGFVAHFVARAAPPDVPGSDGSAERKAVASCRLAGHSEWDLPRLGRLTCWLDRPRKDSRIVLGCAQPAQPLGYPGASIYTRPVKLYCQQLLFSFRPLHVFGRVRTNGVVSGTVWTH